MRLIFLLSLSICSLIWALPGVQNEHTDVLKVTKITLKWNDKTATVWSENCKIKGKKISEQKVSRADCWDLCISNPKCTNFYWRYDGVCSIQSGEVGKKNAAVEVGSTCGYFKPGSRQESDDQMVDGEIETRAGVSGWQRGKPNTLFALNCDFSDQDIGGFPTPDFICGFACQATPGCTHFAWFDGICYRKRGSISLNDAFVKQGVVCGVLADKLSRQGPASISSESSPSTTSKMIDLDDPCEGFDFRKIAINTKCTQYYSCASGKFTKQACPNGQFFDSRVNKCNSDQSFYCVV